MLFFSLGTASTVSSYPLKVLAQVVQTMDSAIHRINHYPLDNSIGFASVYLLDIDLSDGEHYLQVESWKAGKLES